jgi:cytochrome c553
MKLTIMMTLICFSTQIFAMSNIEERLKFLESRVLSLETKLTAGSQTNSSNGLKVKNMNNKKAQRYISNSNNASKPSITEKQQAEIMDQLKAFKTKQSESQKMLDELMKNEF